LKASDVAGVTALAACDIQAEHFAKQRAEMWAACLDFTRLPCLYLLSGPGYFQSLVYKLIT